MTLLAVATFHSPDPLVAGASVTLGEEVAHHMRVRRLEPGETVRLVDGEGGRAVGTLRRLAKGSAQVEVGAVEQLEPELPVHLMVPVADRDRMLWLAEKAAELGAASWRPIVWRRSKSVSPRGEGAPFQAKVRSRMISALEQSGAPWLPTLYPDANLERGLAAAPAEGTRFLLDAAGGPLLAEPLVGPVTVAVGPEGGVEADERERVLAAGFRPVSLGASVLRFETAAVAALAIVRAALLTASREEPAHG